MFPQNAQNDLPSDLAPQEPKRAVSQSSSQRSRAANRQPDPAGCGGVAHRKLAGVDDLFTAWAANRQPASAGCGGETSALIAGEEVCLARAAALQPALAGCVRSREAPGYRHSSHTALHLHHNPHGAAHHQPGSGRSHTCGSRQDPPSLG